MKHKGFRLLFYLILIVFLLSSCNVVDLEKTKNESETPIVLPDVEYKIYYDDKWADAAVYEGELPLKADYGDIDFYQEINVTEMTEGYTDESAQKLRSVTVDGKIHNVEYVNSLQISHSFKKDVEGTVVVDNYTNEDVKVAIYRENGKIYSFSDYTVSIEENGELAVEQAREKAEKIIKEIYGEDMLSKYAYNNGYLSPVEKTVAIVYRRTVFDCFTDESVTLNFNMNGELVRISSRGTIGMFDGAEKDLVSEELVRANKFIVDLYSEKGWTLGERRLAIGNNGEYYLEANLNIPEEQCSFGQKSYGVYINIK